MNFFNLSSERISSFSICPWYISPLAPRNESIVPHPMHFTLYSIVHSVFSLLGSQSNTKAHGWYEQCLHLKRIMYGAILFGFLWPSAFAIFSLGLKHTIVLRAALGGCFTAKATEGNGGGIFLCHAARIQKAVAVCKQELCINCIQYSS